MNYLIYNFTKKFRNGEKSEIVLIDLSESGYDPSNPDEFNSLLKNEMEGWGESTSGGHNYGYRVTCEEVKNPTDEQLEVLIAKKNKSIKDNLMEIKELEKQINFFLNNKK